MSQPGFGQLSCVAEELVPRLRLKATEATLDLNGHGHPRPHGGPADDSHIGLALWPISSLPHLLPGLVDQLRQ
jgi:hypothetical protein